jgi:hypothetical protein
VEKGEESSATSQMDKALAQISKSLANKEPTSALQTLVDYGKSVYQDAVGWFQNASDQVLMLSATLQQIGWTEEDIRKLLQLIPPDLMTHLKPLIIKQLGVSPVIIILLHVLIAIIEVILEQNGISI